MSRALDIRRPVFSRRHIALGTVAVLAVGAIPGMWWGIRYVLYGPSAARLPAERAAARQAGLPLSSAEAQRTLPAAISANRNAALFYNSALNAMTDPDWERDFQKAHVGGKRVPPSSKTRTYFASIAAPLAAVERASHLPDCDWSGAGINNIFAGSASRKLVRLLCLRAEYRNDTGDIDGAFADVETAIRVGHHPGARGQYDVSSLIVEIANRSNADIAYRHILMVHRDDPRIVPLARRSEAAFTAARLPNLKDMARIEYGSLLNVLEDYRRNPASYEVPPPQQNEESEEDSQAEKDPQLPNGPTTLLANAWEANGIAYWRGIDAALTAHSGDLPAQYRAIVAVDAHEEHVAQRPGHEFLKQHSVRFSRVVLHVTSVLARDRMRRTVVALVEARQKNGGHWPATLPPAPPSDPQERTDPFGTGPFHYQVTPQGGYQLYSIGGNFVDEGGAHKAYNDKAASQDDITLRFPHP